MKLKSQSSRDASPSDSALVDWFTPIRFAGFLALLIVLCFPSIVFGLETFVYGDSAQFAYPVAFHLRESFWRGEIPLWNPLNSCGIPFLAQWNTLALYPPSLFYILFPMPWSFGVFCLAHIFFAGLGMYFLARRWTENNLSAVVAGTAFAFNGLTWQGVMWPHLLAALAWMPWLILAAEKAWREGGRAIVLAALAGAMQMLSGGAEVIILTWVVLAVMGVMELIRGNIPRGKFTLRAMSIGLLLGGLSAIQLLPFLDLLMHSQRTSNYGSGGMGGIETMPFSGLMNYLLPLFRCVRNPEGVFVQNDQGWIASYFVGVGIVAFAVLGAWRVRNRRVWMLAGLTVFGLLMALGDPGRIYGIAKRLIPVFGFIRFPVKFVALATFALPLLAGFGVKSLTQAQKQQTSRNFKNAALVGLEIVVVMALALGWEWNHPMPGEDFPAILRNAISRVGILVCLFGCVVLLRRHAEFKLQVLLQVAIMALLWLDVFTHTPTLSPTAPRTVWKPNLVRETLGLKDLTAGTSRAIQSKDSLWKMVSLGSTDPAQDAYMRRFSLSMNLNLLDDIPKFDGFYSMDLKEHLDIFKRVFFRTNDAPELLNFLGISHTSNPTNIFDWVTRDGFLPLVTIGQSPVFVSDEEALQSIFSDSFEPAHTVYLPFEAKDQVHSTASANAKIISTQFSPQRLEMIAEAERPTMVVVAQTFYHPWRAYVDGQPTQLWRANYAFQALEIPAGRHEVKLTYKDSMFLVGTVVSALSAAICIVFWLWCRLRRQEVNA